MHYNSCFPPAPRFGVEASPSLVALLVLVAMARKQPCVLGYMFRSRGGRRTMHKGNRALAYDLQQDRDRA